MHPNKIENLLKLNAKDRVDYFVRQCVDFEEVWGLVLGEDNWITFTDSDGDIIFPLWPNHDLAEFCCFEEHRVLQATPQRISLDAFINQCVSDMENQNVYFGIFYNEKREGLALSANNLKERLESYISFLDE